MNTSDTVTQLLDAAQGLIQGRGYNAFSYKDLAEVVGIRTASIHYHFKAKADLGQALMERYLQELEKALATIERRKGSNKAQLKSYIALHLETESRRSICLCGSLASDQDTLPEEIVDVVAAYLERSEKWVAKKIRDGVSAGEFEPSARTADLAGTLVASLQGGLILSRARGGSSVLEKIQRTFFASLKRP